MPGLARTYEGKPPYVQARAMVHADIRQVISDYADAAANALKAGFDGIEIHAANGYLIDQFLRDNANFRTDDYGGSIENRTRFLSEVTGAVVAAIGADRTGVRLSPNEERQGVNDSRPEPLFEAASAALSKLGIAFLEVREPDFDGTNGRAERPPVAPLMRTEFKGPFILNSDYDDRKAQAALDAGKADAISFGRPFISNPDLPKRFANGLALTPDDKETWYVGGATGYAPPIGGSSSASA
jgi:2,4-dienoyl-CoA reductase-like NADH-dependent reductase (Old Yellow Enzyme family)